MIFLLPCTNGVDHFCLSRFSSKLSSSIKASLNFRLKTSFPAPKWPNVQLLSIKSHIFTSSIHVPKVGYNFFKDHILPTSRCTGLSNEQSCCQEGEIRAISMELCSLKGSLNFTSGLHLQKVLGKCKFVDIEKKIN